MDKRELVDYLKAEHDISHRLACDIVNISRSSYAYKPDMQRNQPVMDALLRLAEDEPMYGLGLMFDTLRREGKPWNHKRVYRIYKLLKLNFKPSLAFLCC